MHNAVAAQPWLKLPLSFHLSVSQSAKTQGQKHNLWRVSPLKSNWSCFHGALGLQVRGDVSQEKCNPSQLAWQIKVKKQKGEGAALARIYLRAYERRHTRSHHRSPSARREREKMSLAPAAAGGCSLLVSFRTEQASWEKNDAQC